MPPVLFTVLSFPFTRLAYILFPVPMANGVISGAFAFCKNHNSSTTIPKFTQTYFLDVLYDCMHYA